MQYFAPSDLRYSAIPYSICGSSMMASEFEWMLAVWKYYALHSDWTCAKMEMALLIHRHGNDDSEEG